MNADTHNRAQTAPVSRQTPMTWGLLAVWLIYSATALGWHLANDPFLSQYICGVK